jgi:hypothetical protein
MKHAIIDDNILVMPFAEENHRYVLLADIKKRSLKFINSSSSNSTNNPPDAKFFQTKQLSLLAAFNHFIISSKFMTKRLAPNILQNSGETLQKPVLYQDRPICTNAAFI